MLCHGRAGGCERPREGARLYTAEWLLCDALHHYLNYFAMQTAHVPH